jgi:hypothetical protein
VTYFIAVEHGELGTERLIGPFDDRDVAEAHAHRVKTTLRFEEFGSNDGHTRRHPDDGRWFCWVLPTEPPRDVIYSDEKGQDVPLIDDYPAPWSED